MLELDEYEMDGIAKLLHIAKRFADRGRLDLLLQASGKDAILSVETYLELEYDLPCLIFEDVTVQRHPEDDWRMFSERTVYIMRDSLLSRFDQLCREYEASQPCVCFHVDTFQFRDGCDFRHCFGCLGGQDQRRITVCMYAHDVYLPFYAIWNRRS